AEISQGEVLETHAAVEEQRAEFEFEAPVAEAEISQGEVLETQAAVEEQRAEFEFEAPVAEAEVSQGEVLETQAAVEEQRAEFETPAASEAQLAASEVAETRSGLEGGVLSTADRQVSGFETSYEAERSVVDAVPGYTARTDVSSAPMPAASVVVDLKNLTLDQIPQQLIDEIVRRTIAQMSENVVREIAWEVVPDLAELLIKKKLEGRL
ncbi:MAG: hypothetical protein NZ558_07975, partial [Blastocatellia bacterium]|nr:hypothetical protein [Blastocatellia bacterium]